MPKIRARTPTHDGTAMPPGITRVPARMLTGRARQPWWGGLGDCCTSLASYCCNRRAQPPVLSITLALLDFLSTEWAEGARHPNRLPRNSPCRKNDAGNFSIVFCQQGRVWFIKTHFPFHMYLVLKQTNAGRCHSSCSCSLDTSQLKYLLLTLSLTSQNQA